MENPSRPIPLTRSVVLTEKSSIPSLLLLGKLVTDGSPADSASRLPDKLRQIWAPSGTVNLWRVTDGAFLVQFYEAGDLTRAHDGAPWSCGDGVFLMQHVKPGINMVDQIAGFTKAELWVRFHGIPMDHFSADSVYALAAAIGEPVNCDLSQTSSAEFLRARIRVDITVPLQRSVVVELENGNKASVSVEFEGIPRFCRSCGICHPADGCPRRANLQAAASASRPAVYAPSNLGPRRSTSGASSSYRGKSSRRYEDDNLTLLATAPAVVPPGSGQERLSPVNGTFFNFLKLKSWRKGVGKHNSSSTGNDSQDQIVPPSNLQENKVLETNSPQQSVREPPIMEVQETQLDTTPVANSYIIVEAQGSRSTEHARIEVMVETHCSPQLIIGAMQWLSKKGECKGLDATYDGKRGVISIFGLQVDQNTDPVDLIAYLLPNRTGPKTRLGETQAKPDSPARFADIMMRFHDANCCKDDSKVLS